MLQQMTVYHGDLLCLRIWWRSYSPNSSYDCKAENILEEEDRRNLRTTTIESKNKEGIRKGSTWL